MERNEDLTRLTGFLQVYREYHDFSYSEDIDVRYLRANLLSKQQYTEVEIMEKYGFTSSEIYNLVFKEEEVIPFASIVNNTDNNAFDYILTFWNKLELIKEYKDKIQMHLFIVRDGDYTDTLCINNTTDFLEFTKGISENPYNYVPTYTQYECEPEIKEKTEKHFKYKENYDYNYTRKGVSYLSSLKRLQNVSKRDILEEYGLIIRGDARIQKQIDYLEGLEWDFWDYRHVSKDDSNSWKDKTKCSKQWLLNQK